MQVLWRESKATTSSFTSEGSSSWMTARSWCQSGSTLWRVSWTLRICHWTSPERPFSRTRSCVSSRRTWWRSAWRCLLRLLRRRTHGVQKEYEWLGMLGILGHVVMDGYFLGLGLKPQPQTFCNVHIEEFGHLRDKPRKDDYKKFYEQQPVLTLWYFLCTLRPWRPFWLQSDLPLKH